jgi:hypothetical protein
MAFAGSPQTQAVREKAAEGEYAEWKDGEPIPGSEVAWVLWSTREGLELEAHLPPDMAASLLFGLARTSRMSPEMRRGAEEYASLREIDLKLSKDFSPQQLRLIGVKLEDVKKLENGKNPSNANGLALAECEIGDAKTNCKSREEKHHLETQAGQQFYFCYPFPPLVSHILRHAGATASQPAAMRLTFFEFDQKTSRFTLATASGKLADEGPEEFMLGQNKFAAEKYVLTMESKTGRHQLRIWASHLGFVAAMEDSALPPGIRIQLMKYRKYAEY